MRLYYTVTGAREPFAKFGLGNPKHPRNNWDVAFLSPEGKPLDLAKYKPRGPVILRRQQIDLDRMIARKHGSGKGPWIRDLALTYAITLPGTSDFAMIQVMQEISNDYPAKADTLLIPWNVSLEHAVFIGAWDARRIVMVPAVRGRINQTLERCLGDADLLREYHDNYTFVKVDTSQAPKALAGALRQAGSAGLIILDEPKKTIRQAATAGFPAVLEIARGPHTTESLMALLEKHALDKSTRIVQQKAQPKRRRKR